MTVRVAVIGAGYMGSAHARVVRRIGEEYPGLVELAYVVDIDEARARRVAARYGGRPLRTPREMDEVDLAIIATPTETHYTVFREVLGKAAAVLVEKPISTDFPSSAEMVELARSHGITVAVGHVERFNPAVRELHRRSLSGEFGEILTAVARRVGPFAPRAQNTDVVFDLGVHEIDNALVLFGSAPEKVRSYTLEGLVSKLTDYAIIVLRYGGGFANIEVNRITYFKERKLYLTTRYSTVQLDYLAQTLRVHREREEVNVRVAREEPLYLEDLSVVESLERGREPDVDGFQGLLAVYVCQLALESRVRDRDVGFEDTEVYSSYSDLIREGLTRLRAYRERVRVGG